MERLSLRVTGKGFLGTRFSVPEMGLRLGRSSSNDIAIRDEELSRNHCLFEPSGESGIRVTDLVSANGTFVNGQRLGSDSVELKLRDVVTAGGATIVVVGDESVDLGLEPTKTGASETPKAAASRRTMRPVLWAVAVLIVVTVAWLVARAPAKTPPAPVADIEQETRVVEMTYEKIRADSTTIFRYAMSLTPDDTMRVVIDDLSGEGRNITRSKKLSPRSLEQIQKILLGRDLSCVDREYVGPDEEPPRMNRWSLAFNTTSARKSILVVNTPLPSVFRRVCEELETFAMNELNIRALQHSREELLSLARASGDTGKMKWEDRDVEYGNLHVCICAYREALADLETINPKPIEYEEYQKALDRATRELDQRYKDQRFVVEQAISTEDWSKARDALVVLCEMIPDTQDVRNHEASLKLNDVEKRLGRKSKGGRR